MMPINTDLLIAAPMLQDSFVDKNGEPMSAGVITCYQDNSRTTLKNWYYQSGTPGNYTYIRLPNPLTLSAAGTICDINGVDTIPFFYPYSELDQTVRQPYFITIVNHDQTNQITRANFPFLPNEDNVTGQGSHENYIINNGFWRNVGTVDATNLLDTVIAPSQHDGFVYPDIHFIKNVTGGQDTITFTKFPLTLEPILTGDITPEFYINHTCANSPTGETQKAYYFPISLHVSTLAAVTYTATIQAQNVGGTAPGQNTINLFILQDTGTGTTSPAPFLIGSITLNSSWTKYEFSTVFPSTAGLTLGAGGDDALYLLVQVPLNISCNVNFTRPSIYLSDDPPTNSFLTYDQVDSIISSPRTGDIRSSLNTFYPYGWVPMNGGTIGDAASAGSGSTVARANQDTWQLFTMLWSMCKPFDAGGGGTFNPICQMYTSTGVAADYGASAYADFTANKGLQLTKMFGQVMMGTVPTSALIGAYNQSVTAAYSVSTWTFTPTGISAFFRGQAVNFTGSVLPTGIVTNAIYYVTNLTGSTFQVATSFANAMAGTAIATANVSAGLSVRVIVQQTGTAIGEYAHTQLVTELAAHTHPGSGGASFVMGSGGALAYGTAGAGSTTVTTTGSRGDSTPFNVTQPGTFYNMYVKL